MSTITRGTGNVFADLGLVGPTAYTPLSPFDPTAQPSAGAAKSQSRTIESGRLVVGGCALPRRPCAKGGLAHGFRGAIW